LRYEPLFPYIQDSVEQTSTPLVKEGRGRFLDKFFQVLDADFVTDDAGTGIAHEAPAF
jgi:isoleucyl-tRNA synthetase